MSKIKSLLNVLSVGFFVSLLVHIGIVFAAYKLIRFVVEQQNDTIEVMVMDVETADLEELKEELKELEELEDVTYEEDLMQDVTMDTQIEDVSDPVEQPSQDNFSELEVLSDFSSPVIMKGLYGSRTASGRASLARRFGGRYAEETEKAVVRALDWLKEDQHEDGSWGKEHHAGITGVALLAYLAHGETPSSEKYGSTVEKAVRYLVNQQDENGIITPGRTETYRHAVATYALAETYAMTRIPSLRPVVEKAVDAMIQGIPTERIDMKNTMEKVADYDREMDNLASVPWFDYSYGKKTRFDSSIMAWHAQALKAAKLAGIKHPDMDKTMKLLANGFKAAQGGESGHYLYSFADSNKSGWDSVTGYCMLCLQLLGYGKDPQVEKGIDLLTQTELDWKGMNFFIKTYYITQAIFHSGDSAWKQWNRKFAPLLVNNQSEDGAWRSYADSDVDTTNIAYESRMGHAYPTSLAALSLMVYYRNLPTFMEKATETNEEEQVEDSDDIEIEII